MGELWSNRPLGVQFGGAPSDRVVRDNKTAKDLYVNRVTELWYSMLEFVQSGQIKGMDSEMATELRERKAETQKAAVGLKMKVEPKSEMKMRMQRSPDVADSSVILLNLCIVRHNFSAHGLEGQKKVIKTNIRNKMRRVNAVWGRANYEPELA
jgi:hypothetical protein